MFREILNLKIKLDEGDLNKMSQNLGRRFDKVAKGFGKGILTALKGGGVIGATLGILDRLMNPFQEVADRIDRVLNRADDLKTFSDQFGTSSGNLFKLESLAKAKGLDPEQLRQLIVKFQSATAEAIADPSKETAVRNFAKPGQDTAEAFFQFIQSMQGMKPEQRTMAQNEIFGEKQILKASEFLNTTPREFNNMLADMALNQNFTPRIDAAAAVADHNEQSLAMREKIDFLSSIGQISPGLVNGKNETGIAQDKYARELLGDFNQIKAAQDIYDLGASKVRGAAYGSWMNSAMGSKSSGSVQQYASEISSSLKGLNDKFDTVLKSKLLRGILNPFGKGN